MLEKILVGETDCSFERLAGEIANSIDDDYDWRALAIALQTPFETIEDCPDPSYTRGAAGTSDIFKILRDWRIRQGNHATLANLMIILEHRCGWSNTSARLKSIFRGIAGTPPTTVSISGTPVSCNPTIIIGETSNSRIIDGYFYDSNEINRRVAVKQFRNWKKPRQVFENELSLIKKNWSSVFETNLIEVFSWGTVNSIYFISMEQATTNVLQLIDLYSLHDTPTLVALLKNAADGLNYLHNLKLPHGNLKPENILIVGQLRSTFSSTKLVAKLSDYSQTRLIRNAKDLIWTSPEEKNGTDKVLTRSLESDVYSLGKIFYLVMFMEREDLKSSKAIKIISKSSNCRLELLPLMESGNSLLFWMLKNECKERPNMCQVSLHPFFWNSNKIFEFIMDIGEVRWRQSSDECSNEWNTICAKIDNAFQSFFAKKLAPLCGNGRGQGPPPFYWSGGLMRNPDLYERNWKDPLISEQDNKYEYNRNSVMSLVEFFRYNLGRYSTSERCPCDFVGKWFSGCYPNFQFSEMKYVEYFLEQFRWLPVILFCGLAFLPDKSTCFEALSKKYSLWEYDGVGNCSDYELISHFIDILRSGQVEIEIGRQESASSIFDDLSSSDEESDGVQDYDSCYEEDVSRKCLRKRKSIKSLEERLPSINDEPEVVKDTGIFYYFSSTNVIGEGANSLVFRGYFSKPEVSAGVKLVFTKEKSEEMKSELDLWKKLGEDTNVVKLFDWKMEKIGKRDFIFISMELAVGNFDEEIRKHLDPFHDTNQLVSYLKNISDGICYLHENNIFHGNITPTSILIVDRGNGKKVAKLGCFIQNHLESSFVVEKDNSERICSCQTGIWMSPEVLKEEIKEKRAIVAKTPESDIFSFGMIIYYGLSRRQKHPFNARWKPITESIMDFDDDPEPLEIRDLVSAEHLIKWMLQKIPGRRPTIKQVVNHSYFWESNKSLLFLQNVVKSELGKYFTENVDLAYKTYYLRLHDSTSEFNWATELCSLFCAGENTQDLNTICTKNLYNFNSVLSLVKFIVELCEQKFQLFELFEERMKLFKCLDMDEKLNSEIVMKSFCDRFPHLIVLLWCVLQEAFVTNLLSFSVFVQKELFFDEEDEKNKLSEKEKILGYRQCWTDSHVQTFLHEFYLLVGKYD